MRELICNTLELKVNNIKSLIAEFKQEISLDIDETIKLGINFEQIDKISKHCKLQSFDDINELYGLIANDVKSILSKTDKYQELIKALEFIYNLSLDLQFSELRHGQDSCTSFDEYINYMRMKHAWGGAPEITIATELFADAKFLVHAKDHSKGIENVQTIKEMRNFNYEINLQYSGGLHYNLLIDAQKFSKYKEIYDLIKSNENIAKMYIGKNNDILPMFKSFELKDKECFIAIKDEPKILEIQDKDVSNTSKKESKILEVKDSEVKETDTLIIDENEAEIFNKSKLTQSNKF